MIVLTVALQLAFTFNSEHPQIDVKIEYDQTALPRIHQRMSFNGSGV
jgi:hypothetical protein